jgi:hypothetical protein
MGAASRLVSTNGRLPGNDSRKSETSQTGSADSAREADPLVAHQARQVIRVVRHQRLGVLGADVAGDQYTAGSRLEPTGEDQPPTGNLVPQPIEVDPPSLIDEVSVLDIGQGEHVEHDSDAIGRRTNRISVT